MPYITTGNVLVVEIKKVSRRGPVATVQVLTGPRTAQRQRECVLFLVLESMHLLPPEKTGGKPDEKKNRNPSFELADDSNTFRGDVCSGCEC